MYKNYITILFDCLQKITLKIGTKSVQQTPGEYDFAGHRAQLTVTPDVSIIEDRVRRGAQLGEVSYRTLFLTIALIVKLYRHVRIPLLSAQDIILTFLDLHFYMAVWEKIMFCVYNVNKIHS